MYKNYIKRLLDIIFALFFIILLLPIMIITGIIIRFALGKLTIKEYNLREGKNKIPFTMYKMRTKIDGTRGLSKKERYTPSTRIIDIFRLNELPQLFNILKGDMSFVGPRPFLVTDDLENDVVDEKRYLVRPGIAGLAQINGARSITQKKKLECDILYYDNMSFWNDFKILLSSPSAIYQEYLRYKKEQEEDEKKLINNN